MKQLANVILKTKFNVLGTLTIAVLASLTTSAVTNYLTSDLLQHVNLAPASEAISSGVSVLDCETGVYSPVQKTCVSQEIFDAEMQRLFAALGMDTSAYQTKNSN